MADFYFIKTKYIARSILLLLCLSLGSCGWFTGRFLGDFGNQLSDAVLNSNDPDTIKQALPSYLLLLDAMARDNDSPALLWSAAKLNSAYGSQFVMDDVQKLRLINKSWQYGQQATCFEKKKWCDIAAKPAKEVAILVEKSGKRDVAFLYNLGSVWASWIDANSGDWNAVAKLGQVRGLMEKVVELDPAYDNGSAYLYLGVLDTFLPEGLGGKPEQGRAYFEKAMELSEGKNLMAQVLLAERYGKLMFDRELHDRVLEEVLAASPVHEGFTLANTMAQERAKQLLADADEYF